MNSHSRSPSSGRSRAARGALRYMSPLQAEAYLLARDAVRRIQRSSALLDVGLMAPAGSAARGERHRLP